MCTEEDQFSHRVDAPRLAVLHQLVGANLIGRQVHPPRVCVTLTVGGATTSAIEYETSWRVQDIGRDK